MAGRWGLAVASGLFLAVAYHALFSGTGLVNDDYPAVYLRIHQYAQEFAFGHFPQAFPDVVRGGGSAFPRFYPPLAYYIGAALYGLVGNIVWAGHLSALMSILLSAVTMAWAARQLGAPPAVAVVAGLAYATFPYRFTNVLVRGAIAESWALAWLPLVFASAVRLAQGSGSGLVLAVTTCLLLATHTSLALWALPMMLATALVACPTRHFLRVAGGMTYYTAVGVCLSGWYLVPMLYYLPGVRVADPNVMWATAAEFARWHIDWAQALGLGRLRDNLQTGSLLPFPMAVSVGLPALVMPFALAMAARNAAYHTVGTAYRLVLAAGISALIALLVMVFPGSVATRLPQQLLYLQFPYRLAGLAGMFATVATALALTRLGTDKAGALLFVVWVVLVGTTTVYEASQSTPTPQVSEKDLLALLHTRDKGLTARYEYMPHTSHPEELGLRVQAAREALGAVASAVADTTDRLQVTLRVAGPMDITLPRLAYDFHQVVDETGRELPAASSDGLLTVSVPAGIHTVTVLRRIPWPARFGLLMTVLSAIALGRPMGFGRIRRHSPSVQG